MSVLPRPIAGGMLSVCFVVSRLISEETNKLHPLKMQQQV